MENQFIYGVFAMVVKLPKLSNSKQEIEDLAEVMKSMTKDVQQRGRFVRAYKKLEDAVEDCYGSNGWLLTRTIESPENVVNGTEHEFYYPRIIEVINH